MRYFNSSGLQKSLKPGNFWRKTWSRCFILTSYNISEREFSGFKVIICLAKSSHFKDCDHLFIKKNARESPREYQILHIPELICSIVYISGAECRQSFVTPSSHDLQTVINSSTRERSPFSSTFIFTIFQRPEVVKKILYFVRKSPK